MALTLLRITDFRNFSSAVISPCAPGLNIIYGDNGSGKTSLLESIHFLIHGGSFRSSAAGPLLRHSSEKFSIFAQLQATADKMLPLGIEKEANGAMRMRLEERNIASWTEITGLSPIRVINTHSHDVFEAGPTFRRKFLDWGLFYGYPEFLSCWRQYNRALKQRNTILKDRRSSQELAAWSAELAKFGIALDTLRRDYVAKLIPFIFNALTELLVLPDLQINYHPGWDEQWSYPEVLADNIQEEYRCGYTLSGPHRADLDIVLEAIPVKHYLSRGQQKLLVCAMMLAQGRLLVQQVNKKVIYLVDDLPAELDLNSRKKLINLLAKEQTQIYITAIERNMITDLISESGEVPTKLFHVEHGCIKENAHRSI